MEMSSRVFSQSMSNKSFKVEAKPLEISGCHSPSFTALTCFRVYNTAQISPVNGISNVKKATAENRVLLRICSNL